MKTVRRFLFVFSVGLLLMFTVFFLTRQRTVSPISINIGEYTPKLLDTQHNAGNKKTDATSVLLLTYMRTGSSMTGRILRQANESIYFFEPLWMFSDTKPSTSNITYVNGSIRLPPWDLDAEKKDMFYNLFTCQIGKIPTRTFTAEFMKYDRKTMMAKRCMKRTDSLPESERLKICGQELQEVCLNSPVRIIKTIRINLASVGHLLHMLPNLKIVHLIRDPRPTLLSQKKMARCIPKLNGLQGCTNTLCKGIENDILEAERLLSIYPGRIQHFLYEDIARSSIKTAKKMFDFIGATFTNKTNDYVFTITMGNKNSSEYVDRWKETMDMDFIQIVQERCNYILKRFKFEFFNPT